MSSKKKHPKVALQPCSIPLQQLELASVPHCPSIRLPKPMAETKPPKPIAETKPAKPMVKTKPAKPKTAEKDFWSYVRPFRVPAHYEALLDEMDAEYDRKLLNSITEADKDVVRAKFLKCNSEVKEPAPPSVQTISAAPAPSEESTSHFDMPILADFGNDETPIAESQSATAQTSSAARTEKKSPVVIPIMKKMTKDPKSKHCKNNLREKWVSSDYGTNSRKNSEDWEMTEMSDKSTEPESVFRSHDISSDEQTDDQMSSKTESRTPRSNRCHLSESSSNVKQFTTSESSVEIIGDVTNNNKTKQRPTISESSIEVLHEEESNKTSQSSVQASDTTNANLVAVSESSTELIDDIATKKMSAAKSKVESANVPPARPVEEATPEKIMNDSLAIFFPSDSSLDDPPDCFRPLDDNDESSSSSSETWTKKCFRRTTNIKGSSSKKQVRRKFRKTVNSRKHLFSSDSSETESCPVKESVKPSTNQTQGNKSGPVKESVNPSTRLMQGIKSGLVLESNKPGTSLMHGNKSGPVKEYVNPSTSLMQGIKSGPVLESSKPGSSRLKGNKSGPMKESVKPGSSLMQANKSGPVLESNKPGTSLLHRNKSGPMKESVKPGTSLMQANKSGPLLESNKPDTSLMHRNKSGPVKESIKPSTSLMQGNKSGPVKESVNPSTSLMQANKSGPVKESVNPSTSLMQGIKSGPVKESVNPSTSLMQANKSGPVKESVNPSTSLMQANKSGPVQSPARPLILNRPENEGTKSTAHVQAKQKESRPVTNINLEIGLDTGAFAKNRKFNLSPAQGTKSDVAQQSVLTKPLSLNTRPENEKTKEVQVPTTSREPRPLSNFSFERALRIGAESEDLISNTMSCSVSEKSAIDDDDYIEINATENFFEDDGHKSLDSEFHDSLKRSDPCLNAPYPNEVSIETEIPDRPTETDPSSLMATGPGEISSESNEFFSEDDEDEDDGVMATAEELEAELKDAIEAKQQLDSQEFCYKFLNTGVKCNECRYNHEAEPSTILVYFRLLCQANLLKKRGIPIEVTGSNKLVSYINLLQNHSELMSGNHRFHLMNEMATYVYIKFEQLQNQGVLIRLDRFMNFFGAELELQVPGFPKANTVTPENHQIFTSLLESLIQLARKWTESDPKNPETLSFLMRLNYLAFNGGFLATGQAKAILKNLITLDFKMEALNLCQYWCFLPEFKLSFEVLDDLIEFALMHNQHPDVIRRIGNILTLQEPETMRARSEKAKLIATRLSQHCFFDPVFLIGQMTEQDVTPLLPLYYRQPIVPLSLEIEHHLSVKAWKELGNLFNKIPPHLVEDIRVYTQNIYKNFSNQAQITYSEWSTGIQTILSMLSKSRVLVPVRKLFLAQLVGGCINTLYPADRQNSAKIFQFATSVGLEPWKVEPLRTASEVEVPRKKLVPICIDLFSEFNPMAGYELLMSEEQSVRGNENEACVGTVIAHLIDRTLEMRSISDEDTDWINRSVILFNNWLFPILTESETTANSDPEDLARMFNRIITAGLVAYSTRKNPDLMDLLVNFAMGKDEVILLDEGSIRGFVTLLFKVQTPLEALQFYHKGQTIGIYEVPEMDQMSLRVRTKAHFTASETEAAIFSAFKEFEAMIGQDELRELSTKSESFLAKRFDVTVQVSAPTPKNLGIRFVEYRSTANISSGQECVRQALETILSVPRNKFLSKESGTGIVRIQPSALIGYLLAFQDSEWD